MQPEGVDDGKRLWRLEVELSSLGKIQYKVLTAWSAGENIDPAGGQMTESAFGVLELHSVPLG